MSYSLEFKNSIIKKYNNGINISQLSRQYDVPRPTIYHWIDIFIKKPVEEMKISKKELMVKHQQIDKLRKENQILRFVLDNTNIAKSTKIQFVHSLKAKQFGVKTVCRILDIDSSSYYHDKNRKPKVTMIEKDDERYKPLIKEEFIKSGGRFGSKKIRVSLMKNGHKISATRVSRLMKEMKLVVNQPDENYSNYHKRSYSYKPNIISKSELYPEVNRIWVSDITHIKVQQNHYYLFVIIDLFSRKVIGYTITDSMEAVHLVGLMKKTFRSRKRPKDLIFHSDQGVQYTSKIFKGCLSSLNVLQSFSKKGCPYDNSVAESFFASFKKEEIYKHIYVDLNHLRKSIKEYISFYNKKRYHASLKYMTPIEFEKANKA